MRTPRQTTRTNRTSMLMATALAVAISACGGGTSGGGTPTGGGTTSPTSPTQTAPETPDPDGDGDLIINGEFIADAATYEAARSEGTVNAYLSYVDTAMSEFLAVFTEETGIEVNFLQMPGGRMMERILTEQAAGVREADIVQVADPAGFQFAQLLDAGVCRPHELPNHDAFDDEYTHPDRMYYSLLLSVMSIAFNEQLVPEEDRPTTFEDFFDPKWGDRQIAISEITNLASGYSFLRLLVEEYGEDAVERLAAQNPVIHSGTGPLHDEILRGEQVVGLGRPPIVAGHRAQGEPIGMNWPARTYAWPSNICLVADSPSPNSAEILMNYLFTVHGQDLLTSLAGDVPVHPDAQPPLSNEGEPYPQVEFFLVSDTQEEVEANLARWGPMFGR